MADCVLRRFDTPDDTRTFERGRLELIRIAGTTLGRAQYEPRWKWSAHVAPVVGTRSCQVAHLGLVLEGLAMVRMDDGEGFELKPGDIFQIAPRHDSWVLGTRLYVSIDLRGAERYGDLEHAGVRDPHALDSAGPQLECGPRAPFILYRTRRVLFRTWRTGVEPHRWSEYARFEREHSLPMFRQQPGCHGVLFVRSSEESGAALCSFWDDQEAIDQLAQSPSYQATVGRLKGTGLLTGTQSVEVFKIASGALDALSGAERF